MENGGVAEEEIVDGMCERQGAKKREVVTM